MEKKFKLITKNAPFLIFGIILFVFIFNLGHLRSFIHRQQVDVANKVKAKTLNYLMPASFSEFIDFVNDPQRKNKSDLDNYVLYFSKVSEYFPQIAEGYGLLGFCQYYIKDPDEAFYSFYKANELNPDYFWYSYNLGVISFKQEKYTFAIKYFNEAIRKTPQHTLEDVVNSKPFKQIFVGKPEYYKEVLNHFKRDHDLSLVFLAASYYELGKQVYSNKEYQKAVALFKGSIDIQPKIPKAYEGLAQALNQLGEKGQAAQFMDIFNKLKKENHTDFPTKEEMDVQIF